MCIFLLLRSQRKAIQKEILHLAYCELIQFRMQMHPNPRRVSDKEKEDPRKLLPGSATAKQGVLAHSSALTTEF